MASFFPHGFRTSDAGFTPLFRLLDDFDVYSRGHGLDGHGRHRRGGQLPTFHPRFDVRETNDSYELHGELPGLQKQDIHIEFTDPQTMIVRGRIERSYTSGTPPAGLVEGSDSQAKAIEAAPVEKESHRTTVQDEDEAQRDEEVGNEVVSTSTTAADKAKYWVSERSVGEFSRSFHFPALVDQEIVTASLKNGILHVEVPKAKKLEGRRINVD